MYLPASCAPVICHENGKPQLSSGGGVPSSWFWNEETHVVDLNLTCPLRQAQQSQAEL